MGIVEDVTLLGIRPKKVKVLKKVTSFEECFLICDDTEKCVFVGSQVGELTEGGTYFMQVEEFSLIFFTFRDSELFT